MSAKAKPTHSTRTDDEITRDVRQRLKLDNDVPDEQISVQVKDGVATLEGEVSQSVQKEAAEAATRKVKGVRNVLNQIEVKPAMSGAAGL